MFEYWRASRALSKARRLGRKINGASPQEAQALKSELIRSARRIKELFLSARAKGLVERIADLYVSSDPEAAPQLGAGKPKMTAELAMECLRALQKMTARTKARAFLVSGTLLGCVREGRILAHDYDIDLGVDVADEFLPDLLKALRSHPDFQLISRQDIDNKLAAVNDWARAHAGRPWLLKFRYKEAIPVDLFIHVEHGGQVFHGSKRNLWVNSSFGLAPRSFYGLEFLAPDNPDAYLTENYGDWRTPKSKFDFSTDTPNARVIHSTAALRFLIEGIIVHGRSGDTRRETILLNRLHQTFEAVE
jgi:hypothetical protein